MHLEISEQERESVVDADQRRRRRRAARPAIPNPFWATARASLTNWLAPELSKFTSALSTADSGLGQFSGSIGDLAKSLLGGLGGGGGGLGSLLSGFAEGGLINGDGTGTSDSNLARSLTASTS